MYMYCKRLCTSSYVHTYCKRLCTSYYIPAFLSLPKLANHSGPLLSIVGATAIVSTLFTAWLPGEYWKMFKVHVNLNNIQHFPKEGEK